ncbi:hypothetical protein IV53_GL000048 [Ligilactobacillus ceti DSM 22408]|uniref:GtrA/DPMS transmembrane domain-containing protein n=2 Tax=Ligilactobacillus TaxID=2767887 RepID=A0A0R2KIY4_9LACO|nr:GtrA family protein [Ligilactobacillus ceti]KRN89331.1 hypothetical protein IV53_GL000048 [Ligilactobacillus ceti DSM 22408]
MLKFIIVGIINTIVGMGAMLIAANVFNCGYWFSSAANYIIGSIVSYFLNKYFTFQDKKKSFKTVLKFIINISVCYLIAYGVAKPLIYAIFSFTSAKIQLNIAMLTGSVIFVALNYLGQRFWAFKH